MGDDDGGGERQVTLGLLLSAIGNGANQENLKNAGTRTLLKMMVAAMYSCNNHPHRMNVRKFMKHLQTPKFEAIQEALYALILDSISQRDEYIATTSTSKTALELLNWITIAGKGSRIVSSTFCRLLATLISRIQLERFEKIAKKKVDGFYKSLDKNVMDNLLKNMIKSNNIVAIGMTVDFLFRNGNLSNLMEDVQIHEKAYKMPELIDIFMKECLLTKVAKSSWTLRKASELILPKVTPEDCEKIVIPGIQKAMLRSPEIAIEAVGYCLIHLRYNFSPHAMELAKAFGTSLNSKEDKTREQAEFASLALNRSLDDSSRLAVLGWYFDVLNGAEGKITVAAHKIGILKTIRLFTLAEKKGGDKSEAIDFSLKRTVKFLESEVHEGTIVEALELIASLIVLVSKVPEELATYLSKTLPNLKGNARTIACRVLALTYSEGRYSQEINPLLTKTYEKSLAQISQVNGLCECIEMASLLISKNAMEGVTDEILTNINEKYATSYPWSAISAANIIVPIFSAQNSTVTPAVWSAVANLLTVKDFLARKEIHSVIFTRLNTLNGYISLCNALRPVFANDEIRSSIKKQILMNMAKASGCLSELDRSSLAITLLWISHMDPTLDTWILAVLAMQLDPKTVVNQKIKEVKKTFVEGFDNSPCMIAIVKTLAFVGGKNVIDSVVEVFASISKDEEIYKVTREEYFIYLTPEDQLFDTSVIEAADTNSKNMKRESRVYSYKEQLEEIQLRKELEEKRRQSGKPVNYTPKQKEAIKIQLAKESKQRAIVAELHGKVSKSIGLLAAILEGNSGIFGQYVKDFISRLVKLVGCPLAANEAVNFFVKLGQAMFGTELKGEAVAYHSLRLIGPNCDLPKDWQQDPILSAIQRSLQHIAKMSQDKYEGLCGAEFSYAFPLLRTALIKYPKEETVSVRVMQIILNVAKDPSEDLLNREAFIPRAEVIGLLYTVIGTHDGMVQNLAVASVFQLSKIVANQTQGVLEDEELRIHLEALNSHLKISRETGMKSLNIMAVCLQRYSGVHSKQLIAEVYREQFDSSPEIASLADDTWKKAEYTLKDELHEQMLQAVLHPCDEVRTSASKALAKFLKTHKSKIDPTISDLIVEYDNYNTPIPPLLDNLGRILQDGIDKWEGRCGVGLAIREISVEMSSDSAKTCMEWLVTKTLSDRSQIVHNVMLEAAVELVKVHGTGCLNEFIFIIERYLEKVGSSGQYDNVRQACVVLMGSLAKHLDPTDARVKSIFATLIDTLSTPSEKVQEAVANCLPALVPAVSAEAESILKRLLEKLMEADNFGERRGAAFGIAGMIKGLGILSLKQHDIMHILATGMQNKKNFKHREGSLMALELLCEFLGRLFEPYIVHVLPYLLQCLGDTNVYVREATENTAKRVMSRLSGHGVKLVLPALIGALHEDSWRTKCGSVDLLGRMAYCAPKQLSGCLPMIVPRLIEVLGDSHVKVQEAGAKALGLIGSVIQNPEIQSVVPILLTALQDPGKKSSSCLTCLLQTEFVHFVDPPSLALIMPVVQRAFLDRSTENRKMACQVIGNMYSLTDHSDLAPYMENVMPGIRASLVDPVPEVRAVAAKALGSMARGMGDKCYDELLPWLMKTLVSEANSVDRSGAAQGLAEVIGALGEDKLHRFMPEIIRKADSDDLAPHVRDGYIMMFIYMPSVFEKAFVVYIGQIIYPILKALADENEFVRETALRAGQRIVNGFAEKAIALLLPELEKGIFDDNWRIRFSSIQLLGDLLYKISGVSGKMSTESAGDDDNFGTEQSQMTIVASLGLERRNRVLAGLYMGRSDVALMVRQAALHVWKVVVANTPKTLREILPTLFSLLLGCLASSSHDKRQVAARTLGDLVRKLGEKFLPEIIPILEKGLDSPKSDEREGVCIGLSEIMASTSREMVLVFVDNLVPTLRKALCDSSPDVREAAAKTFGSLHSTVGSRALDEIVPFLMRKLGDPREGEYALDGLGQILIVKSKSVMPYLIPQLTAPPVNTKALAILAPVAGEALSRHLSKIIPALMSVLADSVGTPREQEEMEYCERIILTVTDEFGVRLLIDDLLLQLKTEKEGLKRAAVKLLAIFCIHTKADIEPYVSQLIRVLFQLMSETDETILNLVAEAVTAIVKSLDSAEKLAYVGDVRQAIRFVQSDLKGKPILPGLCTAKGINPVLPIFREALLNGGADVKEQAALGMGELIALSTETALKPSVIHITGPLIRILGDRYGPHVKLAVLETLTLLLMKVGIHLKAFLPQLRTTFQKASNDTTESVRLKAVTGLAQLNAIFNMNP